MSYCVTIVMARPPRPNTKMTYVYHIEIQQHNYLQSYNYTYTHKLMDIKKL